MFLILSFVPLANETDDRPILKFLDISNTQITPNAIPDITNANEPIGGE